MVWTDGLFKELALCSDGFCGWVAEVYRFVEGGAASPTSTTKAKAAHLGKDPEDTTDPMKYRVLMITWHLYRRWAAMRLADVVPWICDRSILGSVKVIEDSDVTQVQLMPKKLPTRFREWYAGISLGSNCCMPISYCCS